MKAPVHVIGSGFAGAAAAVHLADRGIPVTVWEARDAPGGRASSFIDKATGEALDNGPHLFMGCYHKTLNLLKKLGTADQVAFQQRMVLPLRTPERQLGLSCPPLPAPFSLVAGLLGMKGMRAADRISLLKTGHRLRGASPTDGTVLHWLKGAGASGNTVRLLWDPLCRAIMNLPADEAAAPPFVAAVKIALLGSTRDARLGWARNGLGKLLGHSLREYLAARGSGIRHERVSGITLNKAGAVTGLKSAGGVIKTNRVLLATDPFSAAGLLPAGALKKQIGDFHPAPIVNVYLWFDRPVANWAGETPFMGLVGGPGEWLFDRARMAGRPEAEWGRRLAVVTSAADDLAACKATEITKTIVDDLARYFPQVKKADLENARVSKEGRATVRLTPGVSRPPHGKVEGTTGLYLAGDYTDTGLPCTIEGAVVSGVNAAEKIVSDTT